MFLSLCYGVMALSAVPTSEAFHCAEPRRTLVSLSVSGSRIARLPRQTQTAPLNMFNTHHLEGNGAVSVSAADQQKKEAQQSPASSESLSKQIANLEIAMEEQKEAMAEQKEGVPVDVQNNQVFIQGQQELEGKLSLLQAQFETALIELEGARDHESQMVNAVEIEARKKIRQARTEGRGVSERVRVEMTQRLSTKDQEIKLAKISLAQKEDLIEQWSAERVSIKMLLGQAWNIVKSRSNTRKERFNKKAAETSARNRAAIDSEWSTTRDSAKIMTIHLARLVTSFLKAALYCTPFLGAKILVTWGFVLDKVGGKKK
jgi:hypothetical protein